MSLATRAPAKINLTLHVLGRRADGYHELESLVAFATTGDTLSLAPGEELSLEVTGPMAPLAGAGEDNLVLKAARHLAKRHPGLRLGTFRLVKRLPVAAGIGGGSSDAAAALRLLARVNDLPLDHSTVVEAARATGADVPICLAPRARMMRGVGEALGPSFTLPRIFAVLVNPAVPVATPHVFRALGLTPGQSLMKPPHPPMEKVVRREELCTSLAAARNDLEEPAHGLAPVIAEALDALRTIRNCRLARMSGSGATVFGLFDDCDASAAAARAIRQTHPGWWVKATSLR
jgi:4-diphosphocytidyl-2-C-methyl-D-erythritol kinase